MEILIEVMQQFLKPIKDDFIEEWASGDYRSISECPSYLEVQLIAEAINHITKGYFGEMWELTPDEIVYALENTPKEIIDLLADLLKEQ